MTDMHVHTLRSEDSDETMEAYIGKAKENGVGTICFTDHVDVDPRFGGYRFFEPGKYWADYECAKNHAEGVTLLSGVEFGEPDLFTTEFDEICRQPFDFIIGSVHYMPQYPGMFFSELVASGVPAEDCYEAYWGAVLNCVRFGKFDCLGHLDIPKRYYGSLVYDEKLIREIFRVAVGNGIVLEVNTSSLRRGCDTMMPDAGLLEIYRSEGGKYAVVGSDAHRADDLGAGAAEAKALLAGCGIKEVTFVNRKMSVY